MKDGGQLDPSIWFLRDALASVQILTQVLENPTNWHYLSTIFFLAYGDQNQNQFLLLATKISYFEKYFCIYFLRVHCNFSNVQMFQFYLLRKIMVYASKNLQPQAGGESVLKMLICI